MEAEHMELWKHLEGPLSQLRGQDRQGPGTLRKE